MLTFNILRGSVCERIKIMMIRAMHEVNNGNADYYGADTTKTWLQAGLKSFATYWQKGILRVIGPP